MPVAYSTVTSGVFEFVRQTVKLGVSAPLPCKQASESIFDPIRGYDSMLLIK